MPSFIYPQEIDLSLILLPMSNIQVTLRQIQKNLDELEETMEHSTEKTLANKKRSLNDNKHRRYRDYLMVKQFRVEGESGV